jgi:hypothetical protein
MATNRRHYGGGFKANVPMPAIRGNRTINQLAAEYEEGCPPVLLANVAGMVPLHRPPNYWALR